MSSARVRKELQKSSLYHITKLKWIFMNEKFPMSVFPKGLYSSSGFIKQSFVPDTNQHVNYWQASTKWHIYNKMPLFTYKLLISTELSTQDETLFFPSGSRTQPTLHLIINKTWCGIGLLLTAGARSSCISKDEGKKAYFYLVYYKYGSLSTRDILWFYNI